MKSPFVGVAASIVTVQFVGPTMKFHMIVAIELMRAPQLVINGR